MSEKMAFENYESKGGLGLELRMKITEPIYDYIGKFKYDETTGIKVATAIRRGYVQDKIYHIICTITYDGIEVAIAVYDNVYYDIIIDGIVVVEENGKKGLYNLNTNMEIRACIDDEIYYPVEQDSYTINKYDGSYGFIDWMTGQCVLESMFEDIFRLNFEYSVTIHDLFGQKIIYLVSYGNYMIEMYNSIEEFEQDIEKNNNIADRKTLLDSIERLPDIF